MTVEDEFEFLVEAPEIASPAVPVAEHMFIMEATPLGVHLSPRTAQGWQRLMAKLKVEKHNAFKEWLYQRDRSPRGVRTASAQEIVQANTEVKALKIKIKAARAGLRTWLWCPWEVVPPLNCHIVNVPPMAIPPRRLWTAKKKNEYRTAEIRELTEKLNYALMIGRIPDRASVKVAVPDQNVIEAEAKFERISREFAAAGTGFSEFKLKGLPLETEVEEIARRVASAQGGDGWAGQVGAASAGGTAAVGGSGKGSQGHRPPLVAIEELPRPS